MPTVHFYLYYCAIIAVTNCSALSLQASPHGYNGSYKSILTSSGAFPGYENSSVGSYVSPTARTARKSTFHNDTLVIHASSSKACCFVVQDTINVRFWADYLTHTTAVQSQITSHITFATQFIDTLVTTNVSTAVRTVNQTSSTVAAYGIPTIPNNNNYDPGPWVTEVSLNGSLTTAFGATITSPTQFYVFTSVNVVRVSAIADIDGLPVCTTTSTYRATCSTNTQPQSALYITGINSNAENYFNSSESQRSAIAIDDPDVVPISLSKPFVYIPSSDPFPSRVVNENFGYVPQTLIEWIAQESDYALKFPGITSCLPGGPAIDFSYYFCGSPSFNAGENLLVAQVKEPDLTVSTTITVAGEGCFHPGACHTPATPGATAVTATATVTPEAERLPKAGASSPAQPEETYSPAESNAPLPSQAPNQPLPAPAQIVGSTQVISSEYQATNPSPSSLLNFLSASAPSALNQAPSEAATNSLGNALENSPENVPGATVPPHNPVKPHSNSQGLGAVIAGAFGITPTSPPQSEDNKPSPGPSPIPNYSISVAPSASAIIVNGITSILPATGPGKPLDEGNIPIAVGSQQISQNAASQYVVAGQTITPGAPPIKIQGTEVSVAPSASAIVIAGSTIALSPTKAPGFTVGSEIVTANSASRYVAGGQTLVPGGSAVTVSGTRLSLAPDGAQVIVGSSTIALGPTFTPAPSPSPLTLGSHTYTINSKSEYIIAGQTLTPGGPAITVSGTRLSLAPSATQVIVGSSTIGLGPTFTPPPLTVGSQTFTANSASEYIIDGQTLIPGVPAITVSGTPISLALAATQAVIGHSTIALTPSTASPLLTFGSETFTANSLSDYIIDGQTLIPGAPAITISNTPISLAPDASEAVIGASTETLRSAPTLPPIVIASQTFTANSAGAYVIGSQTVTPGSSGIVVPGSLLAPAPPLSVFTVAGQVFTANPTAFSIDGTTISAGGPGVTISGTPISLEASGVLDVGNSTVTLSAATSTNGPGLVAFTGKGNRVAGVSVYLILASALTVAVLTGIGVRPVGVSLI